MIWQGGKWQTKSKHRNIILYKLESKEITSFEKRNRCPESLSFQFWIKRRDWRGMFNTVRTSLPDHRADVSKGSLSQGTPAHLRNMEDLNNRGWAKTARRIKMKQLRQGMEELCQRQCGSRWELFCIESGCWWVASGDQRVKEWCGQIVEFCGWGELSSWSLFEFY